MITGRSSRLSSSNHLLNLLQAEFPDDENAHDLLASFLKHTTYQRDFCLQLLDLARQRHTAGWGVRRLAMLMIENQMLKLATEDLEEFDFLFGELNLKSRGPGREIVRSVLREGFTTTSLRRFIPEFRRKLQRLNRVHERIRGGRTPDSALHEFLDLSRNDCKVSLGRYLFTAEEVVSEIFKKLRVTDGIRDVDTSEPNYVGEERKHTLAALPQFEARILRRLCESSSVYWVSQETSSEINALVEYPATTVVLVIKLPGSDIEFEIKRAGRKGRNALTVIYARNGYTVPPSHRLDGGSMQWLLRYEANHGSKLAHIYRVAHGVPAPMGNHVSRSTINSVPVLDTEVGALTYFTDNRAFGPKFREMRDAMKDSVSAFRSEGYGNLPHLPGELGLTAQFIGQVTPGQAILCGTSSFRLDKLAAYLSDDGAQRYFKHLPKRAPSAQEAKMFADAVLEEILGCYRPPQVRYRDHGRYLTAAFGVSENRARANRIYLSLLGQIAKFWGTLLAVRGYARGESFVARNVGLRSFWDQGQWKVKIIFMDHDALVIPNSRSGRFFAYGDIPNMIMDERYIWGQTEAKRFAVSELGYLQSIYRVGADVAAKGEALAEVELKDAYKTTQNAVRTKPELRKLFTRGVVEKLLDWDEVVGQYLPLNGNKGAVTRWKNKMRRSFAAKGYPADAFDVYVDVIEKHRAFLERQSFLFAPERRPRRTRKMAS